VAPGTYPSGKSAAISNRRTAAGVRVTLIDGGLDPVPIEAEAADTVAFAIDTGGTLPVVFDQQVPLIMRPRIVRTDPPGGKRDVPLNTRVRIVFSEPMDPASVTGSTLGLLQAGTPVSGEVTLSSDGLEASFQPAADLLPETDYTIEVGNGIRDVAGSELEAPLTADFTTVPPGSGPFGAMEIVIEASGTDVAGEYLASLDGATPLSIYHTLSGRPLFVPALSPGDHVVSLVSPVNCSVENSPVTVTVTSGQLIRVTFSVICEPLRATVRITAPTTGIIPESTRYNLTHGQISYWDYGYGFGPIGSLGNLEPNGTLVFQTEMSGSGAFYWNYFLLGNVPRTCVVLGPNPTGPDSLTFGDTLDIEFPVTCSPSRR